MRIKKSKLWVLCFTVIMAMLINIVPVSAAEIELDFESDFYEYSDNVEFGRQRPFYCDLMDIGVSFIGVDYVAEDALKPGDVVEFTLYGWAYCDNHEGNSSWTSVSDYYVWVNAGDTQIGTISAKGRGYQSETFRYVVPEGGTRDLKIMYNMYLGFRNHKCYTGVSNLTINGNTVKANY